MKRIGKILLILIILVFNFIVGANEKGLRILPIGILMALIFIYLIVKKIKEPDKSIFFKSKIDYLVLIFMFTTTLPFVFGTYCSYADTVEFILKYFFIYSVYVLARNTIIEKRDVNQLITATLICSFVPIILGFDYINGKYLKWILNDLNLIYGDSPSFSTTFGYSNAVAIYMTLCLFLSLQKIKNSENKAVKGITIIYAIFIAYIIWITRSRSTIALIPVVLGTYLIINNRKKIIENWKKVGLICLGVLIIGIPLLLFGINVSDTVVINQQEYIERIQYNFKDNTTYILELDVDSKVKAEEVKDTAFELQIIEGNKYFKEIKIAKKRFGNTNGRVSIEFTPGNEYNYINLRILNDFYGTINIRNFYINGERFILKYKYVPKQLGQIFTDYAFNNRKSFNERAFIYKYCLMIAQDNWIIGQGGNTWKIMLPAVEEYLTLIKETHSYFFELLISFGIVGVIAFLTLIIFLFVKVFKQIKNNKDLKKERIFIFIGLFFVLIHSITFDFSMSFMLVHMMVYIYMAVLIHDEQNIEKIPKAVDYVMIVFLALILSTYIRADIAKYLVEDYKTKQSIVAYPKLYGYARIKEKTANDENCKEILCDIQKFIKKEPYYEQTAISKIYFEQICNNIEKFTDEELESYLDFEINQLKTVKFRTPLFIDTITPRASAMQETIDKLKEYEGKLEDDSKTKEIISTEIKELEELLNSEYEKNIYNIEAIDRTGYTEYEVDAIKEEYLRVLRKDR